MYKDRSREELEPLVRSYLEHFSNRNAGEKAPTPKLISKIQSMVEEMEEKAFRASFGTLSAQELRKSLKILEEIQIEEETKNLKDQKQEQKAPEKTQEKPRRKEKGSNYKGLSNNKR